MAEVAVVVVVVVVIEVMCGSEIDEERESEGGSLGSHEVA